MRALRVLRFFQRFRRWAKYEFEHMDELRIMVGDPCRRGDGKIDTVEVVDVRAGLNKNAYEMIVIPAQPLVREKLLWSLRNEVQMHNEAAERATKIWKEDHPDCEFISPGDCVLMAWLMDRFSKAEAVKNSLTSAISGIRELLEDVVAQTVNLPVCPFCGAVKGVQSHEPDCLSHGINATIKKARGNGNGC